MLDRLATGPLGTYTYGDPNHLDAVTSAPGYSASYDAAGDMTGRNGQVLAYDALRRLISWQNTASNPTSTASYAYDGGGERVQQVVTTNGTTTTTTYVGAYEEVSVTGSSTTTTEYFSAGPATAVSVNGTLSYLANDDLGSVTVALDNAGNVAATALYFPYGGVRYATGTMPTSKGFTGQQQDPSGLDYFHARYYDASVGQFVTADAVQGPNRYVYVGDNPATTTDPTGKCWWVCGAIIGAVVGATVGIVTAVAEGKGLSVDTISNVVTDIALGATAGAAVTTPGGLTGLIVTGVAMLATGNGGKGLGFGNGGAESAFRQLAIGADAGFLGGAATEFVSASVGVAGTSLVTVGSKVLANGVAQGVIAGASDLGTQMATGTSVDHLNWTEAGIATGLGGAGGALFSRWGLFGDRALTDSVGRVTTDTLAESRQPWAGLSGIAQNGISFSFTYYNDTQAYQNQQSIHYQTPRHL